MAQFHCPVCNEGFEQRSRLARHMETSHPVQAPSAADMEQALKGADFPLTRRQAIEFAKDKGRSTELLRQLPGGTYRDAAEVARALGGVKSRDSKPGHQPSKRGGDQATQSLSGSGIASVFEGMSFPASADDLKDHARDNADRPTLAIIERFRSGTYHSMADINRELRAVKKILV